jgi:hypothetical protein
MPIGVRAAKRGLPPIPAFGIGWLYPVCLQGLPYLKPHAWPCPQNRQAPFPWYNIDMTLQKAKFRTAAV